MRFINHIVGTVLLFLSLVLTPAWAQIPSGTYTIGGASPDYATFTAAVADLNTNGLVGDGPVVFNVRTGTYNENLTINAITNASAVNTITFQSEGGDSTLVVLTHASATSTVVLSGADYITFHQMTIETTGLRRVCELSGGATNNTFSNCIINGYSTTSTSYSYALFYSTSTATLDNYNTFSNNVMNYGSHAIVFLGSGTNTEDGLVIENNEFVNQGGYVLRLNYSDNVVIKNNSMTTDVSTTHYGMYLNYCDGPIEIAYNTFWKTTAGQGYGMYLNQCKATSGSRAKVYNNFIYQRGTSGNGYGIYCNYSDYFDFFFNNVHNDHTSTSQAAFRIAGGGTSTINIRNNIFANEGGGYAIYVSTTGAINSIDYNDYYATGTNLGYWSGNRTTFAAFQTANGDDANSLNLDPLFSDEVNGDLHIANTSLEAAGINESGILDDIDGTGRPNPPTIGAHELGSGAANDAGIVNLDQPSTPFCYGSNAVYASLRNFGSTNLTSVTINWSVNGAVQTPFSWTGNLAQLASESVNIGSFNFLDMTSHDVQMWTSLPNGVSDQSTSNDTLLVTNVHPSLSGVYTLGSTGDYANFNAAVDTLEAHGVCGPVTFNVETATYTEQINIQEIPGASSTNRITFQSATGNQADVELTMNTVTFADNYIVKLDGADYITFKNMTISSTDAFDNRVLLITNTATFNEFIGNKLMTISGSNGDEIVYSESASRYDSNNVFDGNWFLNGEMGIWFEGPGSVTDRTGGITIQNNLFETYRYGIYLEYFTDVYIYNNEFINAAVTNPAATQGMLLRGCDSMLNVNKNAIYMVNGTSNYGIELLDCEGSLGNPGLISNNMITVGGTNTSTGIYSNASTNKNIYYNSILTTGTNASSSRAFYLNGPQSASPSLNANFNVVNNIFMATTGKGLYNSVGGILSCDYNDYYVTAGTDISYWISGPNANLAALQAANSDDANSIQQDPLFTSTTDLHILSGSPVVDKALVIAGITDDIDGDSRAPEIGADEITSPLELELRFFKGHVNVDEQVVLQWMMPEPDADHGNETDHTTRYFEVERSLDGVHFESLDRVYPQPEGQNAATSEKAYAYTDKHPVRGFSFYRIKHVQATSGHAYDYSHPIGIRLNAPNEIVFYPNPATDQIFVQSYSKSGKDLSVTISDMRGAEVFHADYPNTQGIFHSELTLPNLEKGIYLLQIIHGNSTLREKLFIR